MRCPKCGTDSDGLFCVDCGSQLSPPEPPCTLIDHCSTCGVVIPTSAKFCVACGAPAVSKHLGLETNTHRDVNQEPQHVSGVQDAFHSRAPWTGTEPPTQGIHDNGRLADMVQPSTRSVARTFTARLLLFVAVIVAFVAIALVMIFSRATGGSAEQHSSPPFPVDALVWEKLEGATPMHKPCTTADPSLIRKALDAGECSAILVQGGQFRLVNWTFPVNMDFAKTGSIAMADSTEIVRNLDSRFGGGYVLDLDRDGQTSSNVPDGGAAEDQSTVETAKLIKKAEGGDAEAQATLGSMYDNGQGVVKDDAEAVRWYRQAAEQAHAGAQNNLGLMYLSGRGLTKDEGEAYFWMSLAAPALGDDGKTNRDKVGADLTEGKRLEIQERCRGWVKTHSPESLSGSATAVPEPAAVKPVIPATGAGSLSTNSGKGNPKSTSNDTATGDGQRHVFVVGHPLVVIDDAGTVCALSEGDALQMASPPPPDATGVSLVVLSSKGSHECAKSDTVIVAVADLQEMQNRMRESIDHGIAELGDKQTRSARRRATSGSE